MKDIADVTCCVIDRTTFFPVAVRLARDFKKVYFHCPNGDGFETVGQDSKGFNYPGVETVREFWPVKDEIDLFVFPDSRDWGLQMELERQGKKVWGSKRGEDLESLRGYWLDVAKEIGLPMPKTVPVKGLTNLRLYLEENRDEKKYIKISRYRGDMETWCADDWLVTRTKLENLAHKWGPLQDTITFYVQDDLDTDIEGGADSYFVGDFPEQVIIGYEKKNLSYLGTVMARSDMPPEIWGPNELLVPILRAKGYCNFFSTEVRVKDDESYLLDPCCRCPSPAGEEQLEMYENFGEIVWHGANGILVQPRWAASYCGEAIIQWTGDKEGPKSIRVPEEIRQWVKLFACAYVDDAFHFPPNQDPECLGCAVGLGNTAEEVVEHLKFLKEQLENQPVQLMIEPMADLLVEINKAQKMGLEFGDGEKMPEPSVVLDSND